MFQHSQVWSHFGWDSIRSRLVHNAHFKGNIALFAETTFTVNTARLLNRKLPLHGALSKSTIGLNPDWSLFNPDVYRKSTNGFEITFGQLIKFNITQKWMLI